MNGIRGIIETHRARLEASGLMRQVVATPLPPHINQIISPHAKALAVLRECPERLQIQPSPMSILFDYTLPKLEPMFMEIGEARARQLIDRLCEHGQQMIAQHGVAGSRTYLERFYGDLPDYTANIKETGGLDRVERAYQDFHFAGIANEYLLLRNRIEEYLRSGLKDKIKEMKIDKAGMISLVMDVLTDNDDLRYIGRVQNISELFLGRAQVRDAGLIHLKGLVNLQILDLQNTFLKDAGFEHLKGLAGLQELYITGTDITDAGLYSLRGLSKLRVLHIGQTKITDAGLQHLKGMAQLVNLFLWATNITDAGLEHLRGLSNLMDLNLASTRVTVEGLRDLKKAIPGVDVVLQ